MEVVVVRWLQLWQPWCRWWCSYCGGESGCRMVRVARGLGWSTMRVVVVGCRGGVAAGKWHPDENLLKEDVNDVLVWVKLYGVHVTAFGKDGLSAISTKLDNIVVAMPKITKEGHNTCAGEKKTMKKPNQTSRGKLRLLDNDGNPLVPMGIMESDSEVEVVFDETNNLRISTSGKDGSEKGYGTNSLLEKWRDSYLNNDDYDPYDDDMLMYFQLYKYPYDMSINQQMATANLDADLQATQVDQTKYQSMIEGLMYLTASRPDISFATFVYMCYQARPTAKHLKETMQGVMMIAKAHQEAYNFWEISSSVGHLKSNIVQQCPLWKLNVPAVYLQQFWKTLSKVPDTKDTIKFKLDNQKIVYTMDMFRSTLNVPLETIENSFIAPATIRFIESFMQKVGYQGIVDKKFPFIRQRIEEDYHLIKDDISLASVYLTGMCYFESSEEEEEEEIAREISSLRKSLKVTIRQKKKSTTPILPPGDERERDEMAEATLLSLTLHKTALAAKAQENVAKLNDDDDDFGTRIEPRSHKEHPKNVDDDDDSEKEKKDEKKDDAKANDDEKKDEMGKTVSPSNPIPSKAQCKTRHISSKYNHITGVILRMCRCQGYMIQRMEKKYVTDRELWKVLGKVDKVLHEIIPHIAERVIDDLIEGNMKRVMADTVIHELDALQAEDDAFRPHHHDDHQEDDAPPEGEKERKDIRHQRVQSLNPNEPPRYLYNNDLFFLKNGNTKERSYILSLYKIHAFPFPKMIWKKIWKIGLEKNSRRSMKKHGYPLNIGRIHGVIEDEKMGIVREWKTNFTYNEAPLIINP
uniref:Putative RNA-directed DNA polymerase n=1 Tax=Tanacetum cinerariifolium TaxID=118510 RepID=A0A699H693_TANCI|nr:putative RNA-directed DNA polymerase [Tanacetum cinerariifolium]